MNKTRYKKLPIYNEGIHPLILLHFLRNSLGMLRKIWTYVGVRAVSAHRPMKGRIA